MKRVFLQLATVVLTSLFLAVPAVAYDHGLADAYADMFAPVKGAKAGKHLQLMKPVQFVNAIKAGKKFVAIDIRTPAETQFVTTVLPGSMVIPLAQLFQHENLAKLPTDTPIIVMCKSGARATAAAIGLRRIGFTRTYVLKGGLKGLIGYMGPKEANQPLGPKTAVR